MNPWAIGGLTWLAASFIAAPLIGRRLRTRTQAPAPETSPPRVPGNNPGAGAARSPDPKRAAEAPRPAPAPDDPHDQIAFTVQGRRCGRIEAWDGDGTLTGERTCGCPPPVDLSDAAIERFIDGHH